MPRAVPGVSMCTARVSTNHYSCIPVWATVSILSLIITELRLGTRPRAAFSLLFVWFSRVRTESLSYRYLEKRWKQYRIEYVRIGLLNPPYVTMLHVGGRRGWRNSMLALWPMVWGTTLQVLMLSYSSTEHAFSYWASVNPPGDFINGYTRCMILSNTSRCTKMETEYLLVRIRVIGNSIGLCTKVHWRKASAA